MTTHVQDTATNRFRTWWAALFAVLSFAVVLGVVLCAAGDTVEPSDLRTADASRAELRWTNKAEIDAAQSAAIEKTGVVDDAKNLIALPVDRVMNFAPTLLESGQTRSDVPAPVAVVAEPAAAEDESADGDSPAEKESAKETPASEPKQ